MKSLKTMMTIAMVLFAGSAMAQTITVGTGGDYATLELADADGWGGADTVVLTDEVHVAADTDANGTSVRIDPGEDLTFVAAAGASPVVMPTADVTRRMFHCTGATVTWDGLTFVGPTDDNSNFEQGVFDLETDDGVGNYTIKNCLFTANNGSDAPVTDYTAAAPALGTINQYIVNGDDERRNDCTINVEACTFNVSSGAAIRLNGRAAVAGNAGDDRDITITNCLLVGCAQGLSVNSAGGATDPAALNAANITLEGCLIVNWTSRGVILRGGVASASNLNNPNITLHRTIIGTTGSGSPFDYDATVMGAAVITALRSTVARGGGDSFEPDANPTGEVGFVLRDLILSVPGSNTVDSPFRDRGIAPASLTVANIAADNALRGETSAETVAAFAAAGVLDGQANDPWTGADPTTTAWSADFNGQIGWFSGTNTYLDVNNEFYKGKASDGYFLEDALAGGAEPTEHVPVELSGFIAD